MTQVPTAPAVSNPPRLSKSKIAAFQHCPRRLWLQVHRRELAEFDDATLARFECGHYVGELARRRFPSGVLVDEDHTEIPAALARTEELLNAEVRHPIFEAAFVRDHVLVRADILEPDNWGGWRLIEVKNARSVGSHIIHDVATQTWVLQGNNVCLSAALVCHVERPLLPTSRSPLVRFIDTDVTLEVGACCPAQAIGGCSGPPHPCRFGTAYPPIAALPAPFV